MLAYAWHADVFVATDAMAATGLTRSTAIDAIDKLVDLGLLRELPNARDAGDYTKGRPSRRFELRSDAAAIVGVDAGRAHLTTTVADLRGKELAREVVELAPEQDTWEGRRFALVSAIDSALRTRGLNTDRVLAICVGVPAPVDADGASPLQAEGFWQRMNPQLDELLRQWAPIVRIENDASLAAVAEGSVGMAVGLQNFVVLLAGDRLGAGVVIDGHLLRGHHGGVGELRAFDYVRGVDSTDGIGLRLSKWARDEVLDAKRSSSDEPMEPLTGQGVLRLARSGDAAAIRLVVRAGALLARITTVLSSIYDPSRVIVAGAVADDLDEVLASASAQLPAQGQPSVPELMCSRLGADAVVTGAVSAAREAARRGVIRLQEPELRRLRRAQDSTLNA